MGGGLIMTDSERQQAVAELRARRAARGLADPLNRLRAITAQAVAAGAEIATEKGNPDHAQTLNQNTLHCRELRR